MKLLLSWVRDFVDVKASAAEIADTLALRGFEVAAVDPVDRDDAIIDLEITANRPDCLSVVGLAREIATAYRLPLDVRLSLARLASGRPAGVAVFLEDEQLCPRYAAAVAEITPAASPSWLTSRLQAAGIRPISPVVDITNYVLIELGHPTHAFDRDKLANGELRIRRAHAGERLTTLDGIERKLGPEMLVIADAERPQAVAGVMGGGASEVSEATRRVVFESAYFDPVSVRRTSKQLGLKTEASARFERGADISAPVMALQRLVALLEQIGAGRAEASIIDCYPHPRGPRALRLRRSRLALVLGMQVPDSEVERILRSLGLTVSPDSDGWTVHSPTFRVDLLREVDLIEEVGRHYGFEKLEATFPPMNAPAPAPDPRIERDRLVRRLLTAAGLTEAITFGFIERSLAEAFQAVGSPSSVRLANPLSAKFDTLRESLLPGLVDAVAHNRRHGQRDVALFEIGARFDRQNGESRGVAIAWTGAGLPEHWSAPGREVDFFDVKGVVEQICGLAGVVPRVVPATLPFLVEGQAATILVGDAPLGNVGRVAPGVVAARDAPKQDKVFVAELDLDRLWSLRIEAEPGVRPLPRFPAVVRDISIAISDALPAEIIRGTIQAAGRGAAAPLAAIRFFDRYHGKGMAEGDVSLSVRLTFQATDRTLTDAEVQESVESIVAALAREHGAVQR